MDDRLRVLREEWLLPLEERLLVLEECLMQLEERLRVLLLEERPLVARSIIAWGACS